MGNIDLQLCEVKTWFVAMSIVKWKGYTRMKPLSVIIPTLNESDNITVLLDRISKPLNQLKMTYEIIFIDDHSSDGTTDAVKNYPDQSHIVIALKKGKLGKAYSLLEGFALARYETLCMIDADLQYPPEAIVPMCQVLEGTKSDIVVTSRSEKQTSGIRKLSSSVFNYIFVKSLFGFDYDTQSGLKVFKKHILQNFNLTPTPWTFDLEFIVRALEHDYRILSYKIPFAERFAGSAKVKLLQVTYELGKESLKLRLNSSKYKVVKAYRKNDVFLQYLMILPHYSTALSLPSNNQPSESAISIFVHELHSFYRERGNRHLLDRSASFAELGASNE